MRITCANCGERSTVRPEDIGRRVVCRRCLTAFVAEEDRPDPVPGPTDLRKCPAFSPPEPGQAGPAPPDGENPDSHKLSACPFCGTKYLVPGELLDRAAIACTGCGRIFTLAGLTPEAAGGSDDWYGKPQNGGSEAWYGKAAAGDPPGVKGPEEPGVPSWFSSLTLVVAVVLGLFGLVEITIVLRDSLISDEFRVRSVAYILLALLFVSYGISFAYLVVRHMVYIRAVFERQESGRRAAGPEP